MESLIFIILRMRFIPNNHLRMKPLPISKKWIGRITLAVLIILLIVKLWLGTCNLFLCGAFVGLLVAYIIFSDYGRD